MPHTFRQVTVGEACPRGAVHGSCAARGCPKTCRRAGGKGHLPIPLAKASALCWEGIPKEAQQEGSFSYVLRALGPDGSKKLHEGF